MVADMTVLPVCDTARFLDDDATELSSDGRPAIGTLFRQIGLLLGLLAAWSARPTAAWADGGLVRVAEVVGNYRITVLTSPTPFRAGPIEIGVQVQDPGSGRQLTDAE